MNNKKTINFYSSVPDKSLFSKSGFYVLDIAILESLGYEVNTSNRITDFLKFWKYDITFIYFYRWGLFPAILSRLFRKPVFFTGGIDNLDKDFVGEDSKTYKIQKHFLKACNIFSNNNIIVSQSDWENVSGVINNIEKKSVLIPHAIMIDQFKEDISIEKKENIITTIVWMGKGNVIRKGIDKSLYVLKELVDRGLDYKFYILGKEGEGTKYLQEIIDKLQLNNHVIFTGFISEEEKIDLLKKSKLYFQLSKFEGFGIAAIEALAAGNIIVHTAKGGLRDTIADFGIKVKVEDSPEKIVDAIVKQQENKFKKQNLSSAVKHLENNFSFDMRKNKLNDILKNH